MSDSGKLPSPSLNLLLHGPKPVKAGTSAPIGTALMASDPMPKTPNKKAKGVARSESCGETYLTPEFVGQVATISCVNRANAALRAPGQIVPTVDFRPIVRAKKLWCAALLNDSLQHSRYAPAWHAGIGF